MVLKGSMKYLNYKRDILDAEKLAQINSEREALAAAIKANDRQAAEESVGSLLQTCNFNKGLGKSEAWLAENVEILFVAVVIALGLRTYALQPFRIPTGSMQPTLNGIRGYQMDREQWPSWGGRAFQFIVNGRTYEHVKLEEDDVFLGMEESNFMFFTRTHLYFEKRGKVTLSASANSVVNGLGLGEALQPSIRKMYLAAQQRRDEEAMMGYAQLLPNDLSPGPPRYPPLPPVAAGLRIPIAGGTELICGYGQTGDLILVDRVSYHFRAPKRGEVFVFDTRDIEGTVNPTERALGRQSGGEHYIKRLAGVPGDTLEIKPVEDNAEADGVLWVNGKVATGGGFDLVHSMENDYHGFLPVKRLAPGQTATLSQSDDPLLSEYFPLGDNSRNSLDGRYWEWPPGSGRFEAVHGYNIVGPAAFALWPVTSHWGFIK